MIITLIDKIRNRWTKNSLSGGKEWGKMRTATIERQLKNGDKIKLSLILDSNRQINEFDELETVCKNIRDMYDNALKNLFQDDSESIIKSIIGMEN